MLPGDLIRQLLQEHALAAAAPDRERGSTDPQTMAEFVAYDFPFDTPPAQALVFPPGASDG
jgi:hypothetical protein